MTYGRWGPAGVTMHYDGSGWSSVVSNTSETLLDMEGYESSRIFAVGGTRRNRYLQWNPYSTAPDDDFNWSLWSSAPDSNEVLFMVNTLSVQGRDEIWLGGYRSPSDADAVMQKWNGKKWVEYTDGSDRKVTSIDGGGNNVVAVGLSNLLLHFDGSLWQDVADAGWDIINWRGVHVTQGGDVFVCGDRGAILRWDGSGWSTDLYINDSEESFQSVDSAGSSAWAVGLNGKIFRAAIKPGQISKTLTLLRMGLST